MARGVIQLSGGTANVLITNFGPEYRYLNKGTTVATFQTVPGIADVVTLEEQQPCAANFSFDVNASLPQVKQGALF